MGNSKKWKALVLSLCMVMSVLLGGTTEVYAANNVYETMGIELDESPMTIYTNQIELRRIDVYNDSFQSDSTAREKVFKSIVCTSSDKSVVSFVTEKIKDKNGAVSYKTSGKINLQGGYSITLLGASPGTATITVKSNILNQTYKFKVTVKDAGLESDAYVHYTGNKYTFTLEGNAKGVSYSSSNKSVAVINKKTGVVRTKKAGTTTISCVADNGKTYTYKMKVKKSGLSYTKLTTYYYTGMREGYYSEFPLVAAGIDVKSWSSSNKKVCKVENLGRLGYLKVVGTGKTTITCTSKSGKKYTCKLTVVGGKTWGGLNRGYRPTLSTLKKHGYYKDINTVKDYGDVMVAIAEYDHKIKLGNGNKPLTSKDVRGAEAIFNNRYPSAIVSDNFSTHVLFTSDNKKKSGRLFIFWYYVDKEKKDAYEPVEMKMKLDESPMTIYTNQTDSKFVSISGTCHSGNEDDYDAMMEKILKNTVCTSSDESVVSFLTEQIYDDETGEMLNKTSGKINLQNGCLFTLLGVSPGTATITVKSDILNETFKFKVTVKDAGL